MIRVRHANQYIRKGRARLKRLGEKFGLEFIAKTEQVRRAIDMTAPGYDRAGRRTLKEIRNLPVVGDVVIGLTRGTTRSKSTTPPERTARMTAPAPKRVHIDGRRVVTSGPFCVWQPNLIQP